MIELKGIGLIGVYFLMKVVVFIDVKVVDEGFCVFLFWEFECVFC